MASRLISFFKARPRLTLIALHLPLIAEYYLQLWDRTHYQFFPFAYIAFAGLLTSRRADEPDRWTAFPRFLLAVWGLTAFSALVLRFVLQRNMPIVGAFAFITLLTAWSAAGRDQGYHRRLTYLSILPWLTLRLPLNYDGDVIHWLQRVTTSVASKSLHRMGFLHYRDGNMLQFPGKTFLIEEACSGVQSLFTILFLAALVMCLKRRSLVHGLLLLTSGLFYAGVMNVVRVVLIAMVWELWAWDLSSGWQHDVVGYGGLLVAAMLLLSTDHLLSFFFDTVPDVPRPGAAGGFRNPLIRLWNAVVSVVPKTVPAAANLAPSPARTAADRDVAERRSWPSTAETLRPTNLFHFHVGLAENWLFSRRYRRLLAAIPGMLVGIGSVILIWWLRHASMDSVLSRYEAAYNEAVIREDTVRQETFLRALDSLRPTEPQYRFRLAQFMLKEGRTNDGLDEIKKLAPESALGMAEARMWLVQQAMTPEPLVPLSVDQIEAQLKAVLNQNLNHLEAHLLLASLYRQKKEGKLAEHHLSEAARINPERNLELALLKRDLKRSPDDLLEYTNRAIAALTEQLQKDRRNPTIRVRLAEALMLAGQEPQAHELLTTGLAENDAIELRSALSNLELLQCDRRLRASPLNRDACVPVVLSALRRDPSNQACVLMLAQLKAIGAEFNAEACQPAIDYWTGEVAADSEELEARVLLSQLWSISGDDQKAADVLQPVVGKYSELAIPYARLLANLKQIDAAALSLDSRMQQAQAAIQSDPKNIDAAVTLAECLLALGRSADARALLQSFAEMPETSRVPSDERLAALFGQATLAEYDRLSGYSMGSPTDSVASFAGVNVPADMNAQLAIDLLSDALRCPAVTVLAIDRLARLTLSTHPVSAQADQLVLQLRLEGDFGAKVLNLIGTNALVLRQYDKARHYLEMANAQLRSRDPMVLNNLATCLVRTNSKERDSLQRALDLANQTLTLLPDHPDALSTRGEVLVAMERWTEAIADLTQSLKLRKNNPEVHRLLEKAYRATNDIPMADEHARRAIELESAQVKS
ncbi:MAG: archaeosortase/exosortase family protein [Planctomycetota bacterium]